MSPQDASKRQPLIQAAVETLRATDGGTLKVVVLNKALFYLDLQWLLETGETATRSTFVALKNGPVVAKYQKRLIEALEESGIARQETGEFGSLPIRLVDDQGAPAAPYAETVSRVVGRIGKMTSAEVSLLSHRNPGWRMAWDAGGARDSSPKPIDMYVALQELAEDDNWLSAPLTAQEQEAVDAATGDRGEPW